MKGGFFIFGLLLNYPQFLYIEIIMNVYEFLGYLRQHHGVDIPTKIISHRNKYTIDVIFMFFEDVEAFLVRDPKERKIVILDRNDIKKEHEYDSFYTGESVYTDEVKEQERSISNLSVSFPKKMF